MTTAEKVKLFGDSCPSGDEDEDKDKDEAFHTSTLGYDEVYSNHPHPEKLTDADKEAAITSSL